MLPKARAYMKSYDRQTKLKNFESQNKILR